MTILWQGRYNMRKLLCFGLLLFSYTTHAQWAVPAICGSGLTGNEENAPPVIELYKDSHIVDNAVLSAFSFGSPATEYANINFPLLKGSDSLLITVSYTPFLSSYFTPQIKGWGGVETVQLPPPGTSSYALYGTVALTVKDARGNTMPNADVMFAPDFPGSDAYTMRSNDSGVIDIHCFQVYPAGNWAYVVSSDGTVSFDAAVTLQSGSSASATGEITQYR